MDIKLWLSRISIARIRPQASGARASWTCNQYSPLHTGLLGHQSWKKAVWTLPDTLDVVTIKRHTGRLVAQGL